MQTSLKFIVCIESLLIAWYCGDMTGARVNVSVTGIVIKGQIERSTGVPQCLFTAEPRDRLGGILGG